MDKLKQNPPYSTPLDATTTRVLLLVTNTGVVGKFLEINAPYIINTKETDPEIQVLYPNDQFLTSTHIADAIH